MTYDADALNTFSGILARTGSLTLYGLPIRRLPNGLTERHDNTTAASNFVRSLMWDQARIDPQWVPLLRTGSKIVLSTKLSLGYRSESCRRRKGMPPWSWISSESSDINLLAASPEHGDCSNVCYSSKITIRHEVGNIQVAPQFILCDDFIESKNECSSHLPGYIYYQRNCSQAIDQAFLPWTFRASVLIVQGTRRNLCSEEHPG